MREQASQGASKAQRSKATPGIGSWPAANVCITGLRVLGFRAIPVANTCNGPKKTKLAAESKTLPRQRASSLVLSHRTAVLSPERAEGEREEAAGCGFRSSRYLLEKRIESLGKSV